MSQGKRWCFTINFPLGTLSSEITGIAETIDWGVYGGCQCEISPSTNRPHIQGFVVFKSNKRFSALREYLPTLRPHWELMKGTLEQSETYCSKEESRIPGTQPYTWGERPENNQGKRTDLELATDLIKSTEGSVERKMRAVAREYPGTYVKFHKGLRDLAETLEDYSQELPAPSVSEFLPWQSRLYDDLCEPVDDRTINYVYDPAGKNGKSSFIRHFLKYHGDDTISVEGKVEHMSHGYKGQKYVFIDLPRAGSDEVGGKPWSPNHLYHFAEKLKNGFFFSGKYDSRQKVFRIPHVVFMSNDPPLTHLWTKDRLNLIQISEVGNEPANLFPHFNFPNA